MIKVDTLYLNQVGKENECAKLADRKNIHDLSYGKNLPISHFIWDNKSMFSITPLDRSLFSLVRSNNPSKGFQAQTLRDYILVQGKISNFIFFQMNFSLGKCFFLVQLCNNLTAEFSESLKVEAQMIFRWNIQ